MGRKPDKRFPVVGIQFPMSAKYNLAPAHKLSNIYNICFVAQALPVFPNRSVAHSAWRYSIAVIVPVTLHGL